MNKFIRIEDSCNNNLSFCNYLQAQILYQSEIKWSGRDIELYKLVPARKRGPRHTKLYWLMIGCWFGKIKNVSPSLAILERCSFVMSVVAEVANGLKLVLNLSTEACSIRIDIKAKELTFSGLRELSIGLATLSGKSRCSLRPMQRKADGRAEICEMEKADC